MRRQRRFIFLGGEHSPFLALHHFLSKKVAPRGGAHIPLHTVILGPIIRGQPKTNLKVTFEQESKQIRYSKYHVKMK